MALESAVFMKLALEREHTLPSAFAWFERQRVARTARVTHISRLTSIQSMIAGPGIDFVRNAGIRMLLPTITLAEYERLCGVEFSA